MSQTSEFAAPMQQAEEAYKRSKEAHAGKLKALFKALLGLSE